MTRGEWFRPVIGLVVMAFGALGMVPAARLLSYEITIASLFVVACGIALLQVAANPYVAVIGPADSAESRLTMVQAFNSMGTFLAPFFGGYLILSRTVGGTRLETTALSLEQRLSDAQATQLPYILVALVLLVLAFVVSRASLPSFGEANRRANAGDRKNLSLWKHQNLVFGIPAMFIYLIAEIGVAAATMRGPAAMWALVLVGLCHSIMFPTIFALGIKGLGPLTEEGSGLLVTAIGGGALVVVQGWIADRYGLQNSFLLTAACEIYILFYALWGSKPTCALASEQLS